jgi:undecaprenyl-diphosphatase
MSAMNRYFFLTRKIIFGLIKPMTTLHAIILAIIEGITEYLPISSTGHMILASTWMGLEKEEFVKNFEVIIQFGAILSVLVLYWRRFLVSKKLLINVIIAFIPTAIIGFALKNVVNEWLGSPYIVAWALLLGGAALIVSDRVFPAHREGRSADQLTLVNCLIIGVVQSIAMVPGVSRSAATIIGGMGVGMSRKESAEFSFFLAVPTLAAAGGYKMLKILKDPGGMPPDSTMLLLIGSFLAFVVALLAIKFFISLLQRFGFSLYGYYRIILGGIILILLSQGRL